MTVQVGHLYKKRTVRRFDGSIRDLYDETQGGAIIRNGQVVNHEAMEELKKKEDDRKVAATAMNAEITAPVAVIEDRVAAPSRLEQLEKRIDNQDEKLDAILAALKK